MVNGAIFASGIAPLQADEQGAFALRIHQILQVV
ncbi:Unannotated [Lentimonas sp. CC4]|nr:Unannotated [Lentimonas sp. CC4]CAA7181690.1 Unannotated [Lentimonas sp. CC8]